MKESKSIGIHGFFSWRYVVYVDMVKSFSYKAKLDFTFYLYKFRGPNKLQVIKYLIFYSSLDILYIQSEEKQ